MHITPMSRERFAFIAVLSCLVLSTAYALSIWNFLNVGLGRVSPYSVFREHSQLRITQVIMLVLLIAGALLFERLRASLPVRVRWACFLVLAIAIGHLGTDSILRLFN